MSRTAKFQYPIVSDHAEYVVSHLRYNLKNIIRDYNARAKKFGGKKLKVGRMFVRENQAVLELGSGVWINELSVVLTGYVNSLEAQGLGVYIPFWR